MAPNVVFRVRIAEQPANQAKKGKKSKKCAKTQKQPDTSLTYV